MNNVENDFKEFHSQYALLFFKHSVLTELNNYMVSSHEEGDISLTSIILYAFDKDDEWWKSRSACSIRDWIDVCASLQQEMIKNHSKETLSKTEALPTIRGL